MPIHGDRASDTDLLKGSQVKLHLLCTWLKATQNIGNICIKSGTLALYPTPYTHTWTYKHTHTHYSTGRVQGQTSSPRDNYLRRPNKAVVVILRQAHICETQKLCSSIAAKSLQSCPTLCDPIDGSPPGSPIPGILQARTLEWAAISFSSA